MYRSEFFCPSLTYPRFKSLLFSKSLILIESGLDKADLRDRHLFQIRNSMKCSPASAKKCVSLAAWYEPLLHLIIVQPEDEFEVTSEPDVMQEELAEVTLEIIHIGMWKGIDGSDIAVWKVGRSRQAGNLFLCESVPDAQSKS